MNDIEEPELKSRLRSWETKALWRQMTHVRVPDEVQQNVGRVQQAGKKSYYAFFEGRRVETVLLYAGVGAVDEVEIGQVPNIMAMACQTGLYCEINDYRSVPDRLLGGHIVVLSGRTLDATAASGNSLIWLDHASRLASRGQIDAALDIVYDQIDTLLKAGDFSRMDEILRRFEPARFSLDLLLGVLTATLPAKTKLHARHEFFQRVERILKDRGEIEPGLLVGLES